ncbi:MAG: hypothetical protein ACYS8Z_00570 [Planctomycetota bacterium]
MQSHFRKLPAVAVQVIREAVAPSRKKQTAFAVNSCVSGQKADADIGNSPQGMPDCTP